MCGFLSLHSVLPWENEKGDSLGSCVFSVLCILGCAGASLISPFPIFLPLSKLIRQRERDIFYLCGFSENTTPRKRAFSSKNETRESKRSSQEHFAPSFLLFSPTFTILSPTFTKLSLTFSCFLRLSLSQCKILTK